MFVILIPVVVVALLILYRARPLRVIPHGVAGVLEVFGAKGAVVPSGMHFGWRLALGNLSLYSLQQQRSDPGAVDMLSSDNVVVGVDIAWTYRITDPIAFHYSRKTAQATFYANVMAALRSACQQRTAQELASDTRWVNQHIQETLNESEEQTGMRVDHVIVEKVNLPVEIANATRESVARQRAAKARVVQAEMEAQAKTMEMETEALIKRHQLDMKMAETKAHEERETLTHSSMLERQRLRANQEASIAREKVDLEATRFSCMLAAFEKDMSLMRAFLEHETWKQRDKANTTIYTSPDLVSRPLLIPPSSRGGH